MMPGIIGLVIAGLVGMSLLELRKRARLVALDCSGRPWLTRKDWASGYAEQESDGIGWMFFMLPFPVLCGSGFWVNRYLGGTTSFRSFDLFGLLFLFLVSSAMLSFRRAA